MAVEHAAGCPRNCPHQRPRIPGHDVARRYECASLLIITNQLATQWDTVFEDDALAAAILALPPKHRITRGCRGSGSPAHEAAQLIGESSARPPENPQSDRGCGRQPKQHVAIGRAPPLRDHPRLEARTPEEWTHSSSVENPRRAPTLRCRFTVPTMAVWRSGAAYCVRVVRNSPNAGRLRECLGER